MHEAHKRAGAGFSKDVQAGGARSRVEEVGSADRARQTPTGESRPGNWTSSRIAKTAGAGDLGRRLAAYTQSLFVLRTVASFLPIAGAATRQ